MKSFLTYVAQDIIKKYGTNLSDIAIVFPNKRASLFLNECLAALVDQPIWCPNYITISDLFRQHSRLVEGDPIKLICDLHKVFVGCTGIDETLDHFYSWGQLLIADFDDVDKNMADAHSLFANLKDIHELDDISYLSEEQKQMIRKFFSNFAEDHNSELKKRFLQLWSHFLDIYTAFNERLDEQGLAYEGSLYRKVVESGDIHFRYKKYLFVGFNMMQKVEQQLCDRLMREGKAAFYWDYDKYYMDGKNEAGHYIRQYLKHYPNELAEMPQDELYDNMAKPKHITYLSASTENVQARYIHAWLLEKERYKEGRKTAIVLADESLLQTVVHSLPEEVKSVNITIGYPLQQTPFYSLIQALISLQTAGHPKGSDCYRLRQVTTLLRHPYAQHISPRYRDLLAELSEHIQFYPSRKTLCPEDDEALQLLFADLEGSDNYNLALIDYLLGILKTIGTHAKDLEDQLFQESLFRSYTLLNRLRGLIADGDLMVDITTLERLIQQLIQTTSIPFHGEPAEGIQIMGVLETRNLDFEHVLVLSAGEGNLPKGVSDASFIPYSLRKAYGLTTVDNKVAIFAYYFHSMLQRAADITLAYNSSTDDKHTGEMSRFMLQLMVESKHDISRRTISMGQTPARHFCVAQEKDEETIKTLNDIGLVSPTFLNTYLRCQKRFFYKYVRGLKEEDVVEEEEIDNSTFGSIFHRAAQLFYLQFASPADLTTNDKGEQQLARPLVITRGQMEMGAKNEELLYRLVDQAFCEILFRSQPGKFHPRYNGLQIINREVITDYLKQLIRIDSQLAPFTILGLEKKVTTRLEIDTAWGKKTLNVGGYIDRLDAVAANGTPGTGNLAERIRVIDYKTGSSPQSRPGDIASIFDPSELSKHTDYYLQSMLYSLIVKHSKKMNPTNDPVSPALLFIQQAGAADYDPILKLGKDLILDAADHEEEFMEGVKKLIGEIYDTAIPFSPTADNRRCANCPYVALCR